MLGWFRTKCPISDDDRRWIEHRFAWLVEQFGINRIQKPIILPTSEFFPDSAEMNPSAMRRLLERVCDYMQVDSKQIALAFYNSSASAGMYDTTGQTATVWLEVGNTQDPVSIIATFAHEIGHH